MSFINKLLNAIGSLFTGLFNEAKKAYKKLSPEQQAALLHGAGIVDIINNNIDQTPNIIRDKIKETYPDLDETKLESGLFELAHAFKLVPASNSLDDIVKAIQEHLKNLTGKVWAAVSHSAAGILSILFAPGETKFAAVASLLEYVYHAFIKKN